MVKEVEGGFSSFEKVMTSQKELPRLALEFEHLKRDLLVQGKIYEILTQQYELAKLSLEAEEPIFQILELAEAPDRKSGPRRSRNRGRLRSRPGEEREETEGARITDRSQTGAWRPGDDRDRHGDLG